MTLAEKSPDFWCRQIDMNRKAAASIRARAEKDPDRQRAARLLKMAAGHEQVARTLALKHRECE